MAFVAGSPLSPRSVLGADSHTSLAAEQGFRLFTSIPAGVRL